MVYTMEYIWRKNLAVEIKAYVHSEDFQMKFDFISTMYFYDLQVAILGIL